MLAAAETAADFAGILYTDAPANGETDAAEPFESIELAIGLRLEATGMRSELGKPYVVIALHVEGVANSTVKRTYLANLRPAQTEARTTSKHFP